MADDPKRRKARENMTIAEKMNPGPERDAKIEEAEALDGRRITSEKSTRR
jgi:hypothetical protein